MRCPTCKITLAPGKATGQTLSPGMGDFGDADDVNTVSLGVPSALIAARSLSMRLRMRDTRALPYLMAPPLRCLGYPIGRQVRILLGIIASMSHR